VHELVHHHVADGLVRVDSDDSEPTLADATARIDEKLRGQVGSRVTLRVLRDGAPLELTIERVPPEARRAQ